MQIKIKINDQTTVGGFKNLHRRIRNVLKTATATVEIKVFDSLQSVDYFTIAIHKNVFKHNYLKGELNLIFNRCGSWNFFNSDNVKRVIIKKKRFFFFFTDKTAVNKKIIKYK